MPVEGSPKIDWNLRTASLVAGSEDPVNIDLLKGRIGAGDGVQLFLH